MRSETPFPPCAGWCSFWPRARKKAAAKPSTPPRAVEEVDRLERVVSGLLDYTRPKEPRRLSLDLAESVKSAVAFMKDDPRAEGVEIRTDLPEGVPRSFGRPGPDPPGAGKPHHKRPGGL